jgi:hypothetical protein
MAKDVNIRRSKENMSMDMEMGNVDFVEVNR